MNRIENRSGDWARLVSRELRVLGLAVVGIVLLSPAVRADDAAQAVSAARLSSVDGHVQISQGNQVLADQAVANTPLFEGTRVAAGDDGRAEIQLEDGSVARLSPGSSLTLTALRGQGGTGDTEIVLETGLGYFEIQGAGQSGTTRIRFGNSVVTSGGFTVLRINLDNLPGELAVFSGNAHLERGNALTLDLHGGESVSLNGADAARYDLNESIEPDSWDTWNSDRDQVLTSEAASKTAATQGFTGNSNPAWNDLDANGNWYNVPGQGNIWSPYEATGAGFDPYGNGYWMWTPRFGYIWVSGYSWGYLPYQCGNWNYYESFGWGWAPGMGGCSPWWGGGGYFVPNIGIGYGGYRPPFPPRNPHRPIGGGGRPGPVPLVAVNRRPSGATGALPVRDRAGTVTIAGHAVQALRPLSPRPQYERSASGFVNRTVGSSAAARAAAVSGPTRAAGQNFNGSRQGYTSNPAGPRPSAGSSGGQHAPAASHPSVGGGYSGGAAAASHPSGGGGGYSGGGSAGAPHAGGGSPGGSAGGGAHR